MSIRIKDLTTTASSPASDDYLAIDGATNGTRKIAASSIGGASSSDDVTNESTVTGATVSDALETLSGDLANITDNTQEIGTLTITVGSNSYTYNGSASVTIALPVYSGGVS